MTMTMNEVGEQELVPVTRWGGRPIDEFLADESVKPKARERDGRICACGHPMSKHREVDVYEDGSLITYSCYPTRTSCLCAEALPVLEVSDIRPFMRKTKGYGDQHALSLGLRGLLAEKDPNELSEASKERLKREKAKAKAEGWTADEKKPRPRSKTAKWLPGWPKCVLEGRGVKCTGKAEDVKPFSINKHGRAVPTEAELTWLLCPAHGADIVTNGFSS